MTVELILDLQWYRTAISSMIFGTTKSDISRNTFILCMWHPFPRRVILLESWFWFNIQSLSYCPWWTPCIAVEQHQYSGKVKDVHQPRHCGLSVYISKKKKPNWFFFCFAAHTTQNTAPHFISAHLVHEDSTTSHKVMVPLFQRIVENLETNASDLLASYSSASMLATLGLHGLLANLGTFLIWTYPIMNDITEISIQMKTYIE